VNGRRAAGSATGDKATRCNVKRASSPLILFLHAQNTEESDGRNASRKGR
jgi:hypothetical protein